MDLPQLASPATIEKTVKALKERNVTPHVVQNKEEALETIKKLIPDGAPVMTGSSTTLQQIGFVDLLKSGQHPWHNVKEAIVNEKDPAKQQELRKQSVLSDYFLGSVHALTEDGIILVASASGSQIPAYAFTSSNLIWVVGAQKIVSNLDAAFERVRNYVLPLEDARMKSTGAAGSMTAKWFIFEREIMGRNIHLILVNEILGF